MVVSEEVARGLAASGVSSQPWAGDRNSNLFGGRLIQVALKLISHEDGETMCKTYAVVRQLPVGAESPPQTCPNQHANTQPPRSALNLPGARVTMQQATLQCTYLHVRPLLCRCRCARAWGWRTCRTSSELRTDALLRGGLRCVLACAQGAGVALPLAAALVSRACTGMQVAAWPCGMGLNYPPRRVTLQLVAHLPQSTWHRVQPGTYPFGAAAHQVGWGHMPPCNVPATMRRRAAIPRHGRNMHATPMPVPLLNEAGAF